MIDIDIAVEAGDWPDEGALRELASKAVHAAMAVLGLAADSSSELSLLFTDDAHIRTLSRDWRGNDKATNVLSFPASEISRSAKLPPLLGDIVLAQETVFAEAALERKPFDHHLIHLVVHGFLHLLGYDHETTEEAEEMEGLERRALARLAIPDPYG